MNETIFLLILLVFQTLGVVGVGRDGGVCVTQLIKILAASWSSLGSRNLVLLYLLEIGCNDFSF